MFQSVFCWVPKAKNALISQIETSHDCSPVLFKKLKGNEYTDLLSVGRVLNAVIRILMS
jgi:hypothetical protein